MQRLLLMAAGAAFALALSSCGAGSTAAPSSAGAPARLSAALTPEYCIQADAAVLALSGPDSAAVVSASGLADTKAVYGKVYYDRATQHYVGSTQLAGDVLFVAFDDPAAGYVEFGAVVPNYDVTPGLNGGLELAQFSFQTGAAEVTRTASIPPGNVPEDAIILEGSIDANNIPTLTWLESLTGDCDNNGEVNISDFSALAVQYRKTADPVDPADSEIRDSDFNKDGEVAITDLQKMGQNLKATLGGYFVKVGTSPTNFVDLEDLDRTVMFPAPKRQDGQIRWTWTGAALTADTYFQVEPYDTGKLNRGTPSANEVFLRPTLTVTYTSVNIGFVGQAAWPANRIAPNGDYIVIVTEKSIDGTAGNAEPFATEMLQLVVTAETDDAPGVPVDITNKAYMGLSAGGGLGSVSLASATRGQLTFKDRGRISVQTFAPGDFTLSDEISFQLLTIDSLAITSVSGASPVSVGPGTDVNFTVSGTFDSDGAVNGNEVVIDLTSFCNWGLVPGTANTGSFSLRTDAPTLETDNANAGDNANVVAEYPNTDNILLHDNRKRSTTPFLVNVT